jgi:hypothetical protein
VLRVHAGVPGRQERQAIEVSAADLDLAQAKDDLRALAQRRGAVAFGIADCALLADEPPGRRPEDLLPGARVAIVVGGSQPRAGEWLSPRSEVLETLGTADRMSVLGNELARTIEDRHGYYALNVPTATDKGDQPFLDFRRAAVEAGVGSASLAGPVLHPDHGLLYLAVVLTTLPLPVDAELATPACPAPSCVAQWEAEGTTPCLSVCPISDGGCLGGTIEDGRIASRQYDAARCSTRVYNHWVPGVPVGPRAGVVDRRRRRAEDDPARELLHAHAVVDHVLERRPGTVLRVRACLPCRCRAARQALGEGAHDARLPRRRR